MAFWSLYAEDSWRSSRVFDRPGTKHGEVAKRSGSLERREREQTPALGWETNGHEVSHLESVN